MSVLTVMRARYPRLLRSDFLQHGALVFLASNFANVLAYGLHFFASRALGVEAYGTLTSLIAVIAIAGLPASIGALVVVRYAAEVHADPAQLRALLDKVVTLSAWTAAAVAAAGIAASGTIAGFLHLDVSLDIVLVGALTAAGIVVAGLRGVLLGVQDFRAYSASVALEAAARISAAVALIAAGFGVTGAVAGFTAAGAVTLLWTAYSAQRYRRTPGAAFGFDLRRLLQSAGGVALGVGSFTILTSLDMVLARHYLDARSAGYYGAVAQTGKILLFLCAFIPTLVLPKGAARASRGVSATKVLVNAALASGVLLVPALLVFGAFPRFIVTALGGHAFAAAAPYVLPYGIAVAGLALLQVAVYYKISIHRFDFVLPVVLAVAAEWLAIARWHANIAEIISVIAAVNFSALLFSLFRINAAGKPSALAVRETIDAPDRALSASAK